MTNIPKHIALAGDSIFDNDGYVPNEPGVIEQLRTSLPTEWSAVKIAVDGDCIRHVHKRVEGFPEYITDLVLSIGGNDALGYSSILNQAKSINDIPRLTAELLKNSELTTKHFWSIWLHSIQIYMFVRFIPRCLLKTRFGGNLYLQPWTYLTA